MEVDQEGAAEKPRYHKDDYRRKNGFRQTSLCDYCGKELGGFNSSMEPAWTSWWDEGTELKICCHECNQKFWKESKEKEAKEKEQDASNEEKASSSKDCV